VSWLDSDEPDTVGVSRVGVWVVRRHYHPRPRRKLAAAAYAQPYKYSKQNICILYYFALSLSVDSERCRVMQPGRLFTRPDRCWLNLAALQTSLRRRDATAVTPRQTQLVTMGCIVMSRLTYTRVIIYRVIKHVGLSVRDSTTSSFSSSNCKQPFTLRADTHITARTHRYVLSR